jgi:hypothetical protein
MERFEAMIEAADRGGAFIPVPAEVVEALGGKGRIPVRATFNGIAYQGSVVSMGGQKVIGLLKAIRTELGKEPGDVITVTLDVDRDERTVTVPDDLRTALDAAGLSDRFDSLSFSHRRETVASIAEAKRPETRARRITQALDRLR